MKTSYIKSMVKNLKNKNFLDEKTGPQGSCQDISFCNSTSAVSSCQ